MPIQSIKVSNFKSFDELEVRLGNLNILVGANASGKSNFLQIFRFLRDIANHGLNNAVSIQGGVEYFRNTSITSSRDFSLKVTYDPNTRFNIRTKKDGRLIGAEIEEITYEFAIEFEKKRRRFKVSSDKLIQKLKFFELKRQAGEIKPRLELGAGESILSNLGRTVTHRFTLPETLRTEHEGIFPLFSERFELSAQTLLLETPFFNLITNSSEKFFENISIYDFDPKLPKKAIPVTGKMDLEEDGSNLAIVLKNILEDKEKKRKFSNLIKDILPFIDDLRVEKFADRLILALQEIYAKKLYLPASFISDGTIHIVALIIALYFEETPIIIIEEPERNIHPFLISKVVNMLEEATQNKQIIVTTHNPEIIKHTNLENVLLISRNKEGFSTICKPAQKEAVKIFLANEIGIEELYIQDLLGV